MCKITLALRESATKFRKLFFHKNEDKDFFFTFFFYCSLVAFFICDDIRLSGKGLLLSKTIQKGTLFTMFQIIFVDGDGLLMGSMGVIVSWIWLRYQEMPRGLGQRRNSGRWLSVLYSCVSLNGEVRVNHRIV